MALASAALLVVSFPNFNQPYCAWVALVPWLVGLRSATARAAFGWSWLVGFLFYLGSIWWLVHLTAFGGIAAILAWLVLCAYLALYFGIFGFLASRLVTRHSSLVTVPAAWVALEYLRSHLLTGFGWNLLGYSQASALSVIQIADLTGVWGVSFLLVMMNVAIAGWMTTSQTRRPLIGVVVAALAVLGAHAYGQQQLARPSQGTPVRIAVVQGNIPQEEKWDEQFQRSILQRYERLTRRAAQQQPDVILWPETSVPGVMELEEGLSVRIEDVARQVRQPLLVGSPMGKWRDGMWELTNSAALVSPDGVITARYDKLHLVPFGEFVPFESVAPWLRDILPPIGNFVPGHGFTVFTVPVRNSEFGIRNDNSALRPGPPVALAGAGTPHSALSFSVLICFEDLFPNLARRFVRHGAQVLATITNDAWFGPTSAAYQHAQASTLRAVELRVPMVRAANTGWSGCIDDRGRWLTSVRDADGKELFVEGIAVCEVTAADTSTLYRRWGDWFPWLCWGVVALTLLRGSRIMNFPSS